MEKNVRTNLDIFKRWKKKLLNFLGKTKKRKIIKMGKFGIYVLFVKERESAAYINVYIEKMKLCKGVFWSGVSFSKSILALPYLGI